MKTGMAMVMGGALVAAGYLAGQAGPQKLLGIADAHAQAAGAVPPGAQTAGEAWCLDFGNSNLQQTEQRLVQYYAQGAQIYGWSYHDSGWEALVCKK